MGHLSYEFRNLVRNVKKPKAYWQESELDEVANEEIVGGQDVLREKLGPSLQVFRLNFLQKWLYRRLKCQLEQKWI